MTSEEQGSPSEFLTVSHKKRTVEVYTLTEDEIRLHAARTACARTQVMWLRDRLLKLSVHVVSSVRRLVLHLPRSTPNLDAWRKIALSLGARAG